MRIVLAACLCTCVLALVETSFAAASSLSQLSGLSTSLESVAALSPPFSPSERSYSQSVPFAASHVNFTATAAQASNVALWATWNAGPEFQLTSGVATAPLALLSSASFNELQIVVVSAEPNATYIVDILRSLIQSSNANLIGMAWRSGNGDAPAALDALVSSMTPANFSSQVFEYAITLAPSVATLRFVPTIDAQASMTYTTNEIAVADGTVEAQSAAQSLRTGQLSEQISVADTKRIRLNTIVTAEDGTTTRTYRFTLTRFEDAAATGAQGLAGGSSSGLAAQATSSTGDHLAAATQRCARPLRIGQSRRQRSAVQRGGWRGTGLSVIVPCVVRSGALLVAVTLSLLW